MSFRSAFIGAVSLVVIATAAAASETSGAYTSLTTANAAACARACADDGICMAWSFHTGNQCQLSAVVSAQASPQALAGGFASRAPVHLRPSAPIVNPDAPPPLSPPAHNIETAEEVPSPPEAQPDGLVLLGGPSEGDLRLGLR